MDTDIEEARALRARLEALLGPSDDAGCVDSSMSVTESINENEEPPAGFLSSRIALLLAENSPEIESHFPEHVLLSEDDRAAEASSNRHSHECSPISETSNDCGEREDYCSDLRVNIKTRDIEIVPDQVEDLGAWPLCRGTSDSTSEDTTSIDDEFNPTEAVDAAELFERCRMEDHEWLLGGRAVFPMVLIVRVHAVRFSQDDGKDASAHAPTPGIGKSPSLGEELVAGSDTGALLIPPPPKVRPYTCTVRNGSFLARADCCTPADTASFEEGATTVPRSTSSATMAVLVKSPTDSLSLEFFDQSSDDSIRSSSKASLGSSCSSSGQRRQRSRSSTSSPPPSASSCSWHAAVAGAELPLALAPPFDPLTSSERRHGHCRSNNISHGSDSSPTSPGLIEEGSKEWRSWVILPDRSSSAGDFLLGCDGAVNTQISSSSSSSSSSANNQNVQGQSKVFGWRLCALLSLSWDPHLSARRRFHHGSIPPSIRNSSLSKAFSNPLSLQLPQPPPLEPLKQPLKLIVVVERIEGLPPRAAKLMTNVQKRRLEYVCESFACTAVLGKLGCNDNNDHTTTASVLTSPSAMSRWSISQGTLVVKQALQLQQEQLTMAAAAMSELNSDQRTLRKNIVHATTRSSRHQDLLVSPSSYHGSVTNDEAAKGDNEMVEDESDDDNEDETSILEVVLPGEPLLNENEDNGIHAGDGRQKGGGVSGDWFTRPFPLTLRAASDPTNSNDGNCKRGSAAASGVFQHRIVPPKEGLVLDVKGGSRSRGGRAILWAGAGSANQRWSFDPLSGRLSPAHAPQLALDVKGARCVEDSPIILWPFKIPAEANQLWRLTRKGMLASRAAPVKARPFHEEGQSPHKYLVLGFRELKQRPQQHQRQQQQQQQQQLTSHSFDSNSSDRSSFSLPAAAVGRPWADYCGRELVLVKPSDPRALRWRWGSCLSWKKAVAAAAAVASTEGGVAVKNSVRRNQQQSNAKAQVPRVGSSSTSTSSYSSEGEDDDDSDLSSDGSSIKDAGNGADDSGEAPMEGSTSDQELDLELGDDEAEMVALDETVVALQAQMAKARREGEDDAAAALAENLRDLLAISEEVALKVNKSREAKRQKAQRKLSTLVVSGGGCRTGDSAARRHNKQGQNKTRKTKKTKKNDTHKREEREPAMVSAAVLSVACTSARKDRPLINAVEHGHSPPSTFDRNRSLIDGRIDFSFRGSLAATTLKKEAPVELDVNHVHASGASMKDVISLFPTSAGRSSSAPAALSNDHPSDSPLDSSSEGRVENAMDDTELCGWFRDGGGNGDSDWSEECENINLATVETERGGMRDIDQGGVGVYNSIGLEEDMDDRAEGEGNEDQGHEKISELAELELVLGQQLVKARRSGEAEVFAQLSSDLRRAQFDLQRLTAQMAATQHLASAAAEEKRNAEQREKKLFRKRQELKFHARQRELVLHGPSFSDARATTVSWPATPLLHHTALPFIGRNQLPLAREEGAPSKVLSIEIADDEEEDAEADEKGETGNELLSVVEERTGRVLAGPAALPWRCTCPSSLSAPPWQAACSCGALRFTSGRLVSLRLPLNVPVPPALLTSKEKKLPSSSSLSGGVDGGGGYDVRGEGSDDDDDGDDFDAANDSYDDGSACSDDNDDSDDDKGGEVEDRQSPGGASAAGAWGGKGWGVGSPLHHLEAVLPVRQPPFPSRSQLLKAHSRRGHRHKGHRHASSRGDNGEGGGDKAATASHHRFFVTVWVRCCFAHEAAPATLAAANLATDEEEAVLEEEEEEAPAPPTPPQPLSRPPQPPPRPPRQPPTSPPPPPPPPTPTYSSSSAPSTFTFLTPSSSSPSSSSSSSSSLTTASSSALVSHKAAVSSVQSLASPGDFGSNKSNGRRSFHMDKLQQIETLLNARGGSQAGGGDGGIEGETSSDDDEDEDEDDDEEDDDDDDVGGGGEEQGTNVCLHLQRMGTSSIENSLGDGGEEDGNAGGAKSFNDVSTESGQDASDKDDGGCSGVCLGLKVGDEVEVRDDPAEGEGDEDDEEGGGSGGWELGVVVGVGGQGPKGWRGRGDFPLVRKHGWEEAFEWAQCRPAPAAITTAATAVVATTAMDTSAAATASFRSEGSGQIDGDGGDSSPLFPLVQEVDSLASRVVDTRPIAAPLEQEVSRPRRESVMVEAGDNGDDDDDNDDEDHVYSVGGDDNWRGMVSITSTTTAAAAALNLGSRVQSLLKRQGNQVCADCPSLRPFYAVVNFGVLVCADCAEAHRNMIANFGGGGGGGGGGEVLSVAARAGCDGLPPSYQGCPDQLSSGVDESDESDENNGDEGDGDHGGAGGGCGWTEEQVVGMEFLWGSNEAARAHFESRVPHDYFLNPGERGGEGGEGGDEVPSPPTFLSSGGEGCNESRRAQWIQDKYQLRRFVPLDDDHDGNSPNRGQREASTSTEEQVADNSIAAVDAELNPGHGGVAKDETEGAALPPPTTQLSVFQEIVGDKGLCGAVNGGSVRKGPKAAAALPEEPFPPTAQLSAQVFALVAPLAPPAPPAPPLQPTAAPVPTEPAPAATPLPLLPSPPSPSSITPSPLLEASPALEPPALEEVFFAVGQEVEVRDGRDEEWEVGTVVEVDASSGRCVVHIKEWDEDFEWLYVRPLLKAACSDQIDDNGGKERKEAGDGGVDSQLAEGTVDGDGKKAKDNNNNPGVTALSGAFSASSLGEKETVGARPCGDLHERQEEEEEKEEEERSTPTEGVSSSSDCRSSSGSDRVEEAAVDVTSLGSKSSCSTSIMGLRRRRSRSEDRRSRSNPQRRGKSSSRSRSRSRGGSRNNSKRKEGFADKNLENNGSNSLVSSRSSRSRSRDSRSSRNISGQKSRLNDGGSSSGSSSSGSNSSSQNNTGRSGGKSTAAFSGETKSSMGSETGTVVVSVAVAAAAAAAAGGGGGGSTLAAAGSAGAAASSSASLGACAIVVSNGKQREGKRSKKQRNGASSTTAAKSGSASGGGTVGHHGSGSWIELVNVDVSCLATSKDGGGGDQENSRAAAAAEAAKTAWVALPSFVGVGAAKDVCASKGLPGFAYRNRKQAFAPRKQTPPEKILRRFVFSKGTSLFMFAPTEAAGSQKKTFPTAAAVIAAATAVGGTVGRVVAAPASPLSLLPSSLPPSSHFQLTPSERS